MSRIRSVHPGLWTDDNFVGMSLAARLFLIGIWNEADDFGIFEWNPTRLKMRLAPADNLEPKTVLAEICLSGFVVRLERAGRSYGIVKNFRKFQRPQKPNLPTIEVDAEIKAIICLSSTDTRPVAESYDNDPGNPPQMEDGKVIRIEEHLPSFGEAAPAVRAREGEDFFNELLRIYPKTKAFSKPRVLALIGRLPADRRASLLAGAREYASEFKARPTSHCTGLERFIAEGLFENYLISDCGSGRKVRVAQDSPQGDAHEAAWRKQGRGVPWQNGYWWFPTEWPPGHGPPAASAIR